MISTIELENKICQALEYARANWCVPKYIILDSNSAWEIKNSKKFVPARNQNNGRDGDTIFGVRIASVKSIDGEEFMEVV